MQWMIRATLLVAGLSSLVTEANACHRCQSANQCRTSCHRCHRTCCCCQSSGVGAAAAGPAAATASAAIGGNADGWATVTAPSFVGANNNSGNNNTSGNNSNTGNNSNVNTNGTIQNSWKTLAEYFRKAENKAAYDLLPDNIKQKLNAAG